MDEHKNSQLEKPSWKDNIFNIKGISSSNQLDLNQTLTCQKTTETKLQDSRINKSLNTNKIHDFNQQDLIDNKQNPLKIRQIEIKITLFLSRRNLNQTLKLKNEKLDLNKRSLIIPDPSLGFRCVKI